MSNEAATQVTNVRRLSEKAMPWLRDMARKESPDFPDATIPGDLVNSLPDYEAAVAALDRLELSVGAVVEREPHHYYEEWLTMRRALIVARAILDEIGSAR